MRGIDRDRLIAMNEIKLRGRGILIMANEYEKVYKEDWDNSQIKQDNLDNIWEIIVTNQLALTEILRKNGV